MGSRRGLGEFEVTLGAELQQHAISNSAAAADPSEAAPLAARPLMALWLLAAAAIVAGVFFRFYHVDEKPIWDDEVITWMHFLGVSEREVVEAAPNFRHVSDLREALHPTTAPRPVSDVVTVLLAEDPHHPPVYYVIAHGWVSLFGDSVRAVRTLSAVIGLLAIPCMYWLCIELFESSTAGLIGATLIALAPIDVLYSQEAREYSLWLVCILIVSAFYIRAFRSTSLRGWGLYCLGLTFSLYVFPLTAFVAGAHAIVGLCAHTSTRNRLSSMAAIAIALILFGPWLLVILLHLSEINASMSKLVNSEPFQFQTLLGILRILRLDNLDFNGGQQLFVRFATIPLVLFLGYAIYEVRRMKVQASRIFVWALLACSALPLIGLDFFLGGHRIDVARYFTPVFLGFDLALVALFSRKLSGTSSPSARLVSWQAAFGLVIAARIASCAQSAMAPTWWNSYNIQSRQVAAQLSDSPHPLIISDDYILWTLVLAEYLNPSFDVALNPRCYQCRLTRTGSVSDLVPERSTGSRTVVLVAPSKELLTTVRAAMTAEGVAADLECVDVRDSCPGGFPLWASGY
jgi:uncharacterized membrane protein